MKRPFLAAAVAVLVVSNGFVLLQVAMNRRGAPEAELELTTRELRYNYATDSPGTMTIAWENSADFQQPGAAGWYDQRKLRDTGFDTSVPPGSKDAARHYQNSESREVFVALEFDGPGWRKWIEQNKAKLEIQTKDNPNRASEIPRAEEAWENTSSRLVAVDAGLDPEALRRAYPDRNRVMIVRGLARMILESDGQPAYLRGMVTQISSQTINLPAEFKGLTAYASYIVTLRVGRRYEPWIAGLKFTR